MKNPKHFDQLIFSKNIVIKIFITDILSKTHKWEDGDMKRPIYIILLLSLFASAHLLAQAGDRITSLDPENAEKYAKPFATFTGAYFNSGGYYTAHVPKMFKFRFTVVGMIVSVPDDQRTFTPILPSGYDNSQQTATFFGDRGTAYPGPSGFIVFPPGINQTSIPAGIPQIAGSIAGAELLIRYFPKLKIDDTEVKLLGWGLKYNISQWIPTLPVDIAVQILYNNFTSEYKGDNERNDFKLDTKNWAFNAHASKSFDLFVLYGGLQYETTTLDLDYNYRFDPNDPSLDQGVTAKADGDNSFRLTIGGALQLPVLALNLDYSLTSQSVLTGGVSLGF
jgi:hypothetical protein